MLVQDSLTIKYLTGIDLEEGYLVVDDQFACFTDARYYSMVKPLIEKVGAKAVLLKDFNTVCDYIKSRGHSTVQMDFNRTAVSQYKKIKSHFKVKDYSQRLEKMRSVKDKSELSSIKKACEIAQSAFYFATTQITEGMTELELKEILEQKMLSLGATQTSFDTIVAFGKNSAVPHHRTSNTALQKNQPVLIDMGCKVNGYCSDITRTVFFGKPTQQFEHCYQTVLNANLKAIENITNKTTTCQADGVARTVIEQNGFGENFTHSLGHGVGLEIHEYPTLNKKTNQALKNNMVFTIEPGVYFDGQFGIRIEDTVVLKDGKVKRLFTDDKNLICIK